MTPSSLKPLGVDQLCHVPVSGDLAMAASSLGATMARDEVRQRLGGCADYMLYETEEGVYFAAGTEVSLTLTANGIMLEGAAGQQNLPLGQNPLAAVQQALVHLGGGLAARFYGWAAFELAALLQGEPVADAQAPLLYLMSPAHEITLRPGSADLRVADAALLEIWQQALVRAPEKVPQARVAVDLTQGARAYESAAGEAIREIDGSGFRKLILSRPVAVPGQVDMVSSYQALRQANTPARSFLLHMAGQDVAGVSPGTIVDVTEAGQVRSQPLAGTRALGATRQERVALRAELLSDPKEIYEHALSVELAQAEIARVCLPESVAIRDFMQVVERGSVQHIASTVEGQLAPGKSAWDAFASLFPPVTTSGIPKRRAVQEIQAREVSARGLYSGAVLTGTLGGALDAALVIRSVFASGGQTWLRAGAGLIASSNAARELEETNEKLRSASLHLVPQGATPEAG